MLDFLKTNPNEEPFKLHSPINLVFNADDTLCRTSDYFRQELIDHFVKNEDWKNLEVLARHATDNLYKLPELHQNLIRDVIIPAENYILNVRPSLLFNYFFLIPGNFDPETKVSICTMRGTTPNAMAKTKEWFAYFNPVVNIHDFHVLNPQETPNKIDYLRNVYGDDFLLIDDNPFNDVTKIHDYSQNVVVYDAYAKYECNRNQIPLTFDRGQYNYFNRRLD